MNREKHLTPLPEAYNGKAWIVKKGPGMVDLKKSTMFVPSGDNAADFFVRLHEMGHAKYTPKREPSILAKRHGVTAEALQVCEDSRIHHKLREDGFEDKMTGCLSYQDAKNYVAYCMSQANPYRELGRVLIGAGGTDDSARLKGAINAHARKLSGLVQKNPPAAEHCHPAIEQCLRAIKSAEHIYAETYLKTRDSSSFKNRTVFMAKLFDELFPVVPRKPMDDFTDKMRREYASRNPGSMVPWAEMRGPIRPHLLNRQGVRNIDRGHRAVECGSFLRFVHRLPIDKAIFSMTRRKAGGTLLLDASGSMGIDDGDIVRFLKVCPHGQVAMYAGNNGRKFGTLVIIASGGSCATAEQIRDIRESIGQRNLIDGPALRWLSKQPGKLGWVSDGYVTGLNEQAAVNLIDDVMEICQKNHIQRFESISLAIDAFMKK